MKLFAAGVIAAICFTLDQLSKNWAKQHLSSMICKPFVPGLLRLCLVTNTGGAFGVGCGNNTALMLFAAAVLLAVFVWVGKQEKSARHLTVVQWCGVGFLTGGALGNLYDRLTLGHVTDFLDFAFINFPVFNLSDVFVDIGIGLVVIGAVVLADSSKVFSK